MNVISTIGNFRIILNGRGRMQALKESLRRRLKTKYVTVYMEGLNNGAPQYRYTAANRSGVVISTGYAIIT